MTMQSTKRVCVRGTAQERRTHTRAAAAGHLNIEHVGLQSEMSAQMGELGLLGLQTTATASMHITPTGIVDEYVPHIQGQGQSP
jgi:hypothetical protein